MENPNTHNRLFAGSKLIPIISQIFPPTLLQAEIGVSQLPSWEPEQVRERGLRLLDFMAKRWDFVYENNSEKEELLFLNF